MISRPLLVAVLLCASGASLGQDTAAARSLAATCATCHGTDGRSVSKDVMPLAGLPREHIVAQMKAFKDGTRPATIMHQLAKGYTDEQIESLAAYFAARK